MIAQPPDHLRSIERPLQYQLLALAAIVSVLGAFSLGWQWGLAAGAGVVAGMLYYRLLAIQIRGQFARGSRPKPVVMIGCLAMRQIVCLAVPAVCFFALGTAWLASLVTLVVARHWILPVAWIHPPTVS